MPLSIDIQVFDRADRTNFSCQLLRLFAKAQGPNYERLKTAFPNAEAVYWAWYQGSPIPDLEYDGGGL